MAQVLVTESYLDDIADAIREKNGSEDTYTPAQMAGAIENIQTADEVVLVSKSVTANGTYNPASDSADGYSGVSVDVPNTYTASDNGKVVVNQALTDQTSKSINANGTHDTTANNSVVVDVPNSYAAADEGKVVSNGALVAQTSATKTANGTYDTTLYNEIVVNVPTQTLIQKSITANGTYNPSDDNADGYSQVTVNVSGGGSGGISDAFAEYDFTKLSGTIKNVQYGTTGAVFSTVTSWLNLVAQKINDISIELDIASMQLTSGTHRRLLMPSSQNGFIYRSSGVWSFYNGSWYESDITDGSYLDNAILTAYVDTNNYWHFYKNNVLFFEPSGAQSLMTNDANYGIFSIGSYNGNTINNAVIRRVKIYDGLHIS